MLTLRQWLTGLSKAAVNTINHDGIEHAGYLAFLGLLALFPFLVFMVAVVGFFGQGESGILLITTLLRDLPPHVADALKPRVVEIVSGPPQGLLTASIVGAVWTASSAVEGLRTILNRAYHVATPPAYWFRRSMSILQLLVFTFIMITAMALLVAIPLLWQHLQDWLGFHIMAEHQAVWNQVLFPITVAILFFAVCYIYYIIPNIKQHLMSVAPGALIVVALWLLTAHLFTLYLLHFNQVNLIYGSLGGIIAALVFFYLCNIIFIFGAEFNHQVADMLGLRIVQKREVTGGTK